MRAARRSRASRRATSGNCSSGSRAPAPAPAKTTKRPSTTGRKTTMTKPERSHPDELIVGLVSVRDRATAGVYEDKGIPALEEWLGAALKSPWRAEKRLIHDDAATISATLTALVDG